MNQYNQRDIVLANFPFSNQIQSKVRPVLIISNGNYNERTGDYLVCGISSSSKDNDYTIDIANVELINGELKVESKIKCDYLLLLEKDMIRTKIATISNKLYSCVKDKIINLIK